MYMWKSLVGIEDYSILVKNKLMLIKALELPQRHVQWALFVASTSS